MRLLLQKPIFWVVFLILITGIFIFLTFFVTKNKNQPQIAKKPGGCLILEEKYCLQGKKIQITRNGVTETYIAFNLPANVPLFAPEDGRLLDKVKESGDPFSGLSVSLLKPVPPGGAYVFIGLQVDNMLQVNNPKKDSIIGYGNSTGTKNYGADVLVTVTKRTPNGPATDEEQLKKIFHLK